MTRPQPLSSKPPPRKSKRTKPRTTDDELQVPDGTESEEDDGETADVDQADDDVEPDSEQGRFVADNARVRITNEDGTTGYTTVAELKSGSLRNADYTRKTQEVAEQRKQFETQSSAYKQREQQLEQQAQYVASLVQAIVPAEPSLEMLDVDPMGYQRQKATREQWIQHLNYLDGQRQQTEQARQAEYQKQEAEIADREWSTLLTKVPAFKDEAKSKAFVGDVAKYGAALGFRPEELRRIGLDHRQAIVMRGYIQWQKLQANKANVQKKVEGRPPVTRGGKRLNPSEHRARGASEALANAKKTGSLDDVTAAYLASLNKG